jgi:ABC-type transporter MlaC component
VAAETRRRRRGGASRRRPAAFALAVVAVALLATAAAISPARAVDAVRGIPDGPLERTREVLTESNRIVTGPGDRNQKLVQLKDLLRGFLDTDALAKKAMGKHLDGVPKAQVSDFYAVFRELFVRTYVQRLLLFDAPDFEYRGENIDGDAATVNTEIVTPKDEFAVDYRLRRDGKSWIATDVLVEDVSLADNFRAQFDRALSSGSFSELLTRLKNKLANKPSADAF